ncbi:hypothetical protein HDV02_002605 [Globomyces sp. JEL0801]|nr:hypothetical protein HDV02_002605 [Globomyces sp. JEL0801]
MFYQNWTLCVPLFFVLSGRVLTTSALRKGDIKPVVSSMIRRPFRLTLPIIGVMLVAWMMFHLNMFYLTTPEYPCPDPDFAFCASPEKVAHSFYQMFVRPFLFVTNTAGVFPNQQSPIPIPYTAWTLPLEYSNSNYIYLLTIVLINFKTQVHLQYLVMFGALWCTLFTHLWTAHFIVGVIFADLSNRGILQKIKSYRWTPLVNTLLFLVVGYFTLDTRFSIGPKMEVWVKSWQVGYDTNFGNWSTESHFEEKPTVLLLCSTIIYIVETTDILQWFLGLDIFVFLGRISFMMYLFHPFFNYSFQPFVLGYFDVTTLFGKTMVFCICTVVICIVSELLTRLIDIPIMNGVVLAYNKIFKSNFNFNTYLPVTTKLEKDSMIKSLD